jgi:hypothetical protein
MLTSEPIDSGDPALALLRINTGRLAAVFLPGVGGRLLSLRLDGTEILWVNPAIFSDDFICTRPRASWPRIDGTFSSWTNVGGSKTWPAPQGWENDSQWPGPPDAVLDAGVWNAKVDISPGSLTVSMVSPNDTRTGLQVTRCFTFREGSTNFDEEISFTNVSDRPVRWSMWEVAQVATAMGGGVVVEQHGARAPLDLGHYAGEVTMSIQDGAAILPIVEGVAKFGFPAATGLVTWVSSEGVSLSLKVDVTETATYPDGGSRVELWTQSPHSEPLADPPGLHPDAWLVELEVLSPLYTLKPESSSHFSVHWDVTSGPTDAKGRTRRPAMTE